MGWRWRTDRAAEEPISHPPTLCSDRGGTSVGRESSEPEDKQTGLRRPAQVCMWGVGWGVYQEAGGVVQQAAETAAEASLQERGVLRGDGMEVIGHHFTADLRAVLLTCRSKIRDSFKLNTIYLSHISVVAKNR